MIRIVTGFICAALCFVMMRLFSWLISKWFNRKFSTEMAAIVARQRAESKHGFRWSGNSDPGPRMRMSDEMMLHTIAKNMFAKGASDEEIVVTVQPLAAQAYPGCTVRISRTGGKLRFAYTIRKGEAS